MNDKPRTNFPPGTSASIERAMRSFQLYRKPLVEPIRYVNDYTPEERGRLHEAFQQVAAKYRRHIGTALAAAVGFAGCCILGAALREPAIGWLAMVCWLVALCASVTSPPLVCPGCDNRIETINRYCPDCGGARVVRHSIFKAPECTACGKMLRTHRYRTYRMRFCTHCGILLDEKGL
jgi:predicted RNA-binding Zn-ribbon protein involved in translation (DUF1610 family)